MPTGEVETDRYLAGIFIGGQSTRMAGIPKGLLQPPGEGRCLVERLVEQLASAGIHQIVLVGNNEAYQCLALPVIQDAPIGHGPMAGLLGLVEHAATRTIEFVLALACDMPHLDTSLIRRLIEEHPDVDALVPRRKRWEPLCARYRASRIRRPLQRLLEARQYRVMALAEELGAGYTELSLAEFEYDALADWDSPQDLPSGVRLLGKPRVLPPA